MPSAAAFSAATSLPGATATSSTAADAPSEIASLARRLPKAELHLHLDGSLSDAFCTERMPALGVVSPLVRHPRFATFTEWAVAAKSDPGLLSDDMMSCRNAAGNDKLNLFNWANQFLQTEADLEAATTELCSRLASDHAVVYCELRFCPTLHTLRGLSEASALEAVLRGFASVGLPGGVLVCALRTLAPEHWAAMAALAADSAAVGFDVAGFEPGFGLEPMREAISAAVASPRCGVTLHAAEWPGTATEGGGCETLANVEVALSLGVERVGHALQLGGRRELEVRAARCGIPPLSLLGPFPRRPGLQARLRAAGVHVECNPFGNTRLLGGALCAHPLREFLAAGVSASVSCDNTLFSGSPRYTHDGGPSRQLAALRHEYGLSWSQLLECTLSAIDAGFDRSVDKEALKQRVAAGYRSLLGDALDPPQQQPHLPPRGSAPPAPSASCLSPAAAPSPRARLPSTAIFALWKPRGVEVEQASVPAAGSSRKTTLNDYLGRLPPSAGGRFSAVGRLDKETDGLLLLTDDGKLSERLLRPGVVRKVYEATVRLREPGRPSPEQLRRLLAGVELKDGTARLSRVQVVREWQLPPPAAIRTTGARNAKRRASNVARARAARACALPAEPASGADPCAAEGGGGSAAAPPSPALPGERAFVLRLSIAIGRNRVVRRLLAAVGLPVFGLRRLAFGPLALDGALGWGGGASEEEDGLYALLLSGPGELVRLNGAQEERLRAICNV